MSGDLEKEGRLANVDFQEPQVGAQIPVHPQAGSRKNRMSLTTEYDYRVRREYDDLYHWPRAREMVGKVK